MVTIKDIAAATGVSATTVSNVINGKAGRVSAETINKINTAIKELGYVPNMSAKSLVSRSSKVIGFVNHILTVKDSNFHMRISKQKKRIWNHCTPGLE